MHSRQGGSIGCCPFRHDANGTEGTIPLDSVLCCVFLSRFFLCLLPRDLCSSKELPIPRVLSTETTRTRNLCNRAFTISVRRSHKSRRNRNVQILHAIDSLSPRQQRHWQEIGENKVLFLLRNISDFPVSLCMLRNMARLCGFIFHHRFACKMFSGLSFFDKHIKIRYLRWVVQEGNKMFDTRG